MKKFTKFLLVFGIIFLIIGLVFYGAAYDYNKKNDAPTETIVKNFNADDINAINFTENVADVIIKTGEHFGVMAENIKQENLDITLTDGTLSIKSKESKRFNLGFIQFQIPNIIGRRTPIIYVYIPENKYFDKISTSDNVGSLNIDLIQAKEFQFDSSVGNLDIDTIKAEKVALYGGVGNKKISGEISGDCIFEVGVGNINFSGTIGGNVDIKGGVGNISVNIASAKEKFNLHLESGIGNIKIDGQKISDFINDTYTQKYDSATQSLTANSGIGNIDINFN